MRGEVAHPYKDYFDLTLSLVIVGFNTPPPRTGLRLAWSVDKCGLNNRDLCQGADL